MNKKENRWGGCRKRAGRKPDPIPKVNVQLRLTEEQRDKLKRLGWSKWLGERLDNIRIA